MTRRILIVDDAAGVRRAQAATLCAAGFEVVEAVDERDALRKLAAGRVHLVITDAQGPSLDGVSLIRAIREDATHRFTPVVVVTAESQGERRQEGKAAGATGWIVKPFTPDQLLAVIRRVIGA